MDPKKVYMICPECQEIKLDDGRVSVGMKCVECEKLDEYSGPDPVEE